MNFGKRTRLAGCLVMIVALGSGCGGGAVGVRSNFIGGQSGAAPALSSTPSATGSGGAAPGLTASGGRGLGLVLVLGLVIADGVQWAAARLRQALGDADPPDGVRYPERERQ